MKGAYNLNPPLPRYASLWDYNIVPYSLKKWFPTKHIDIKQLSLKNLMLILLTTGAGLDTISKLSLDDLKISTSKYIFDTSGLNKQSRLGYLDPSLTLRVYAPDKRLCIFTYLTENPARTVECRKETRAIFLTYKQPMHAASKNTLSRWAKPVLKSSRWETKYFTAHSTIGDRRLVKLPNIFFYLR